MAKAVADFTKDLADVVEERWLTVQNLVDQQKAAPRDELARFVYGTAKRVWKQINPQHKENSQKRKDAWEAAKGMLKEIIDFPLWNPNGYEPACVRAVLEDKVAEVLKNYLHFVLTGEVITRHAPPKLLGETDEMLCIDKPPMLTCGYGGGGLLPATSGCRSATQLLNSSKATVQIHEYLALKFDYECATETRQFWEEAKQKGMTEQPCWCGRCVTCARMQAGCCNRLDKETSGVMVAAKTLKGFPQIRKQFESVHTLEEGGTEKYYFALVHGEMRVPTEKKQKTPDWKVEPWGPTKSRGKISIAMFYDEVQRKAFPWDDGNPDSWKRPQKPSNGKHGEEREDGCEPGEARGRRLDAITFYEPVAWFVDRLKNDEQYTLLYIQIITGRTHQIRFHCSQLGHCLVGDCLYGAQQSDRDWAKRVCLHSYRTKFMEPNAQKWFEAISPLPKDLGDVLSTLKLRRVQEGCPLFLSRRQYPSLEKIFKPYDAASKLLQPHDPPRIAPPNPAEKSEVFEEGRAETQNSWNWNNQNHKDQKSWNDWSGELGWAQNSTNSTMEDDDDDETWGNWKPMKPAVPEPAEPPAKRPRVDEAPAPVQNLAPRTPERLGAAPSRSPWVRKESTRQAGIFYYLNQITMEVLVEPPPPWEKKQSRRDANVWYYWNTMTNETSLEKPVIS